MSVKRVPVVRRIFRGIYEIDTSKLDNKLVIANKRVDIECGDSSSIFVNKTEIFGSDKLLGYIAHGGKGSDSFLTMLVSDVLERVLLSMQFLKMEYIVEFKKTKDYSHMKSDIRTMIKEFVINRKEYSMRNIFFERVKLTNTSDRLSDLKITGKSFGYFVVSKDGTSYTNDVTNMVLVKSDPRNGFLNITERAYRNLRSNHPDFNFMKKDSNAQLNKQLTEDIIPYV